MFCEGGCFGQSLVSSVLGAVSVTLVSVRCRVDQLVDWQSVQVFMKSVKLEWCLGDIRKAKELLDESVKHYPSFAKVRILHFELSCSLL